MEKAMITHNCETAVMDRTLPTSNLVDEKSIFYAKFIIFLKSRSLILNDPTYEEYKFRFEQETNPLRKAMIIQEFIDNNFFALWYNIERNKDIRDISYFDTSNDFIKQFKI